MTTDQFYVSDIAIHVDFNGCADDPHNVGGFRERGIVRLNESDEILLSLIWSNGWGSPGVRGSLRA